MSRDAAPQTIYLKDYVAPKFEILETRLCFDLYEDYTTVESRLKIKATASDDATVDSLKLDGQDLELMSLKVDGSELPNNQYQTDEESLTIFSPPSEFELSITTKIYPQNNTSLEGLYKSNKMFCTQCEAEGFRKITYYLDRPDVMSVYTTKIIADADKYPVLLSNGNLVASGRSDDGRHWCEWSDPFKKPAYLFALVAGDLQKVEDTFTTCSGREIKLEIFVEEKDLDKCDHAMQSLKNAMRWDEEVYGREYDLDIYMIVAVDDFNMGAMENKGLNIFNTSCVLANPKTTTDAGFLRVEGVVAHEYFHNWSGNRVTCRDWFQLSLKEGFTVFRDEEFSSDMNSKTVKRVEDVQVMRNLQFVEDAGPMAHPVQPSSFIEISNFYTLTVYEKGAEVVRMLHTLLGAEKFREACDLYFERHDGQAVTIQDFVAAMSDVSGRDLSQFMNWYTQAGTPVLNAQGQYDENAKQYRLSISQSCPTTPEAKAEDKKPYHIPLALGLLGKNEELALNASVSGNKTQLGKHWVWELKDQHQEIVFEDVKESPVPSLLRNFSAPVKLKFEYSDLDLLRIMSVDSDGYNRWNASQELALKAIKSGIEGSTELSNNSALSSLVEGYASLIKNTELDPAMVSLMMDLPSESYIGDTQEIALVDDNHYSRKRIKQIVAEMLEQELMQCYNRCMDSLVDCQLVNADSIAKRSLMNRCLSYLALIDKLECQRLVQAQYKNARNMTEESAALTAIVHSEIDALKEIQSTALNDFYKHWQAEALVVNLWFQIQATAPVDGALGTVKTLIAHPAYSATNPNKIRSVIGAFANQNLVNFHSKDGQGYYFLADQIISLNKKNPQIAARLVTPLSKWRRYDSGRSELMRAALEKIAGESDISKDVFEIVNKSLAG